MRDTGNINLWRHSAKIASNASTAKPKTQGALDIHCRAINKGISAKIPRYRGNEAGEQDTVC